MTKRYDLMVPNWGKYTASLDGIDRTTMKQMVYYPFGGRKVRKFFYENVSGENGREHQNDLFASVVSWFPSARNI